MVRQVAIEQYLVNETSLAFPVVFRQWITQSQVPFEVRELLRDLIELIELIDVEGFTQRTCAIPAPPVGPAVAQE